jgi:hypothetical protein
MRGGYRWAIGRQVSAREPTQHVGELDHGRRPRSQPVINLSRTFLSFARIGSVRCV